MSRLKTLKMMPKPCFHFAFLVPLLFWGSSLAASAQMPPPPAPAGGEKYVVALEFPLKVGTTNEQFTGKGIVVDAAGNIYVAGSMAGAEEYSPNGTWKQSIGTGHIVMGPPHGGIIHDPGGAMASPAGGRMYFPFGITLDAAGNIYMTDGLTECIQKFAADGSYIGACALPTTDQGQPPNVVGIGVDGQGMIYTADQTSDAIMKFGVDGTYLASYGAKGKQLGQFTDIRFLAVDGDQLYAVDSLNPRVEVMKLDGTFVRTFGGTGSGNGQFTLPDGIGVDGSHNVYVSDGSRVEKFDSTGKFLTNIRSSYQSQSAGQASHTPSTSPLGEILGIAVSKNGIVYVPDANRRVVVFKPTP